MTEERPNPDELLEKVQREEARRKRGRLKVFFGACAGVGKTYAMLSAAQAMRREGADVVVGVAETHGRAETDALLEGLEALPPRLIDYRGRRLKELDLDGALRRRPAVILVDELAHSNVPGSRHAKRWQDVDELLDAGIDVLTTLNVQHLETLNDVVGQITGIRVSETLPDKVFDRADEVALVDLPPDELLRRLNEGKVYIPEQAQRAIQNFFRKGNLIALRELALRRTADRVDAQMREYRNDRSIRDVWQAKERVLVCIGPGAAAERVVRSGSRLAANLHTDWIVVYVETARLQRASASERQHVFDALRLAQELGAETRTLAGDGIIDTVIAYARSRNVSKVLFGRSRRAPLSWLVRPPLSEQLARSATDIDVLIVGDRPAARTETAPKRPAVGGHPDRLRPRRWAQYAWAVAVCVLVTLGATPLRRYFALENILMLYLLGIVIVATRLGRGPGVVASVLAVAAFDFFFVPPRFSFAVSDTQYLLTFAVMLGVALLISNLAANLRYQAQVAMHRERRAISLHELGRELAGALLVEQIVEIAERHVSGVFQVRTWVILPSLQDRLLPPRPGRDGAAIPDPSIAQWVYDNQKPAGLGTDTLAGASMLYLPLKAPMRTRGVLALEPLHPTADNTWGLFMPEQQRLLETFAAQIALALERTHYVEVAQQALLKIESEHLRNSLLGALSHDLRTPLTALVGLADTLRLGTPSMASPQREIVGAIHSEALRMSDLVNNILDMARLQAQNVKLNRQWQVLEEVVGGALAARQQVLSAHKVVVDLPADLPLVEFDGVLIERVLCNLLENAAKYTPPGTEIRIRARVHEREIWVSVVDEGPGLPKGMHEAIFEKFTRGAKESATPGVGLGLAICRAIVEAHKGRIWAEDSSSGGARITFALPLGEPPQLPGPEQEEMIGRESTAPR